MYRTIDDILTTCNIWHFNFFFILLAKQIALSGACMTISYISYAHEVKINSSSIYFSYLSNVIHEHCT